MRAAGWILAGAAAVAGAGWARLASGADCNQNGIEDSIEIRSGAAADCNGNGIPDRCDVLPVNYALDAPSRSQFNSPV